MVAASQPLAVAAGLEILTRGGNAADAAVATGWVQVATGTEHSCALGAGGRIECWGSNAEGQLAVPSGTFTSLDASYGGYSCAIGSGGDRGEEARSSLGHGHQTPGQQGRGPGLRHGGTAVREEKGLEQEEQDRPYRPRSPDVPRGTRHRGRGKACGRRRGEARAEEAGLRGSGEIAAAFKKAGTRVEGMLNLDMVNYRGSEKEIYFVSDNTSADQNAFLGRLIDAYLGYSWGTLKCGYACSDHAPWTKSGYHASYAFESTFEHHNPYIHKVTDTLDKCGGSAEHALKFARLGVAYAVELAK